MVVQHNLQAMNANRMLGLTTKTVSGSTEKLSSGYRINRAADDAAGLAISEKMRKQVRGLTQAAANAEDGISCVQTAEGALAEVQDMLQRMNELCVQAANGTNSVSDRQYIQDEIDQLVSEVDRIAETTKFNETFLLKGDQTGAKTSVYITNYSTTYTKNEVPNGYAGNPTTYCMNYIGTNNLYVVSAEVLESSPSIALGADKIGTGDDMTKYLEKNTAADNKGKAALNTASYTAFMNVELDSNVSGGADLYIDGTTSVVKAKQELFIYNTENSTVTRITRDTVMTKYLSDDNTMKDQYRLVDYVDSSRAQSTGSKILSQVTNNTAFAWDDKKLEIDESMQKLYDADGQEVSGVALHQYFDEQGNYKGGLFKTSQARATDEVFTSTSLAQQMAKPGETASTIGKYITQSSKQIAEGLTFQLHVGAQSDRKNKISATIDTLTAAGLGIDMLASFNIGIVDETGNNATDAIDVVGEALQRVSRQRSALGAVQNRLDHTVKNLDNIVENTTAAESAIRDTDMAEEMVRYANANILQQAGQSMLAQANQSNEGVLSLLQ
ncbi:MAG: flagellar hook protein [Lachnospiraceae bacterium]|nr:flagellar hook protein [Lachnospiraceae bacterium]